MEELRQFAEEEFEELLGRHWRAVGVPEGGGHHVLDVAGFSVGEFYLDSALSFAVATAGRVAAVGTRFAWQPPMVLHQLRLKSSEPTFFRTVFVRQITCVTPVVCWGISHTNDVSELAGWEPAFLEREPPPTGFYVSLRFARSAVYEVVVVAKIDLCPRACLIGCRTLKY